MYTWRTRRLEVDTRERVHTPQHSLGSRTSSGSLHALVVVIVVEVLALTRGAGGGLERLFGEHVEFCGQGVDGECSNG